jgi:hypothetical protein
MIQNKDMDKTIRIVHMCQKLSKLGGHIIQYSNTIKNYPPSTICSYHKHIEQSNRIREFIKISESLHKEWENNDKSINKYWAGLS